jgi:hypothetical protein
MLAHVKMNLLSQESNMNPQETICRALKNKKVCVVSIPGAHSWLESVKSELEQDGIRCASVSIPMRFTISMWGGTNKDVDEFYNGIMLNIIRQLNIEIDFKQWLNDNTQILPSRTLFVETFLGMVFEKVSEDIIIFFYGIDELPAEVKNGFFAKLRSVHEKRASRPKQGYGRLTFCLLGNIPKTFFHDVNNPPFNIAFEWIEV